MSYQNSPSIIENDEETAVLLVSTLLPSMTTTSQLRRVAILAGMLLLLLLLLVVAGGGTVGRRPAVGASYDPSSDHPEDHNLDRLIREERAKHVREHAHDDRARHRFGGGRPSMTPSAVVARVVIVATDTVVAPPPTMRDIFCTEHCAYLCDHAQKKSSQREYGWKNKCKHDCIYKYKWRRNTKVAIRGVRWTRRATHRHPLELSNRPRPVGDADLERGATRNTTDILL